MAITTFPNRMIYSVHLHEEDIQLDTNWDDVTCPICLEFPHNSVLLQCSSYHKGCRPFLCDTDHTHSNCLNRFKSACKMSTPPKDCPDNRPICPLCRGDVTGWVVLVDARAHLDMKKRCCEEKNCSYIGNFMELKEHAQRKHPNSRPSEIDPARQMDWENFQQSSEIVDVLSTIHAEVPHGVVLGDYVIEYGSENGADEFEDFHRRRGRWWTSCIMYKVFGGSTGSRNRRRSRGSSTTRGSHWSGSDGSNRGDSSPMSSEYRFNESSFDPVGMSGGGAISTGMVSRHSWRRRSRLYD